MEALAAILIGLMAGLIGTVVMTVTETVDIRVTGREPSTVPGQVGIKVLGRDPDQEPRLKGVSTTVHWLHGITMGALRGLLALTGLGAVLATVVHFVLVWSGDALTYKALGIAPMPWGWSRRELATDLFHKAVYAVATGVAYELLADAL